MNKKFRPKCPKCGKTKGLSARQIGGILVWRDTTDGAVYDFSFPCGEEFTVPRPGGKKRA